MLQLSSILVPLDGSAFAEQALPIARRLAAASSATLRLVYVHTPSATWDPGVEFSLFDPEVEQQVREREYAYLDSLSKKLTKGGGLHVDCTLLNGQIAESLEEYAERTGTDLVVMTSHGRGGVGRMVLGNVADQLVHHLNVPVLILRPEEKKKAGSGPQANRILVPLDGSALAESILDQAVVFASLMGSELMLASVVQPIPVLLPPFVWAPDRLTESPEQRELETRRYLEGIKDQLRRQGHKVQSRVRKGSKIATEILALAREEECGMIAMATHGASGLDRLMLGSVADQVVRHADVPVLVLRPKIREAPAEVEPAEACTLGFAVTSRP
jgi:nucleotide-binding universal stress UspA family protein